MVGKRGQAILSSLIYILVELVIVAMFIVAVLIKVNAASNDQTYQKRFYARDLALTTDAMMAAEGDLQLEHELITKKEMPIDIYLKLGSVAILDHSENEDEKSTEVYFLYGTSDSVKIQQSISKSSNDNSVLRENGAYIRSVVIKKENDEMSLHDPNLVTRVGDIELK